MIKSGIDTLDLITEENREKEIKGFEGVDQQKTTPIKRGYKIVVKPSIKKNRTSTRQEVQSYIEGITKKIGECKIERLDLSTDYRNLDLETDKDYKLLRLFIECIRKIRNSKNQHFQPLWG